MDCTAPAGTGLRKIPETFMHEGRRFELERRSGRIALYRQIHLKHGLIAYEVHIIRVNPARRTERGVSYEAAERLGGNADFGRWAWSFGGPNKRELALEKFEELQRKEELTRQRPATGVPAELVDAESPPPHGGGNPRRRQRPPAPQERMAEVQPGERIKIGGAVITRQRPGTAKGFCFITLKDETGLANAIVRPKLFEEARLVINLEPALVITGRVQNEQGVVHVMAEQIEAMPGPGLLAQGSHDYA